MVLSLILFQGGLGALSGFVPMVLIIGVFYVLLIRPQQKRQRELQETISQLKTGDRVVTTGGIIGTITTVRDTSFLIRSADKSILEIARSAVAGIYEEEKKSYFFVRSICNEKEEYTSAHNYYRNCYAAGFVCCDWPTTPA